MMSYGLAAFSPRAGPAKRSLLLNGYICEVMSLRCDEEIRNYLEDTGLSHVGEETPTSPQSMTHEGWRESSLVYDFPSAKREEVQAMGLPLDATHQASGGATPIRLIPPSGELDTWAIATAPRTRPSELLVIQSSTPFSQAMDELCEAMARWSLRDDVPPAASACRPSTPTEELCEEIASLSLGTLPFTEAEDHFAVCEEEPLFCGYFSFGEDSESVCDSLSDATCVEEDSVISWTTACDEEDAGRKGDLFGEVKDVLSGMLYEPQTALPSLVKPTTLEAFFSSPRAPTRSYTVTASVDVGLQCWRYSTYLTTSSYFAPALREVALR